MQTTMTLFDHQMSAIVTCFVDTARHKLVKSHALKLTSRLVPDVTFIYLSLSTTFFSRTREFRNLSTIAAGRSRFRPIQRSMKNNEQFKFGPRHRSSI
jgi:hypothetical protein